MDKYSRLILALVFVGLVIVRLIRYLQIATGRRRISAIPSTSMAIPNQPVPASVDLTPTLPPAVPGGVVRFGLGAIAGVVSWIMGNALLWTALFGFQYPDSIPVFWRLFVGVFVNFYLIRLSGYVAKRVTARTDTPRAAGNPFD